MHLAHLFTENDYLLLSLEDGDFRRLHNTAADVLEPEFVLLLAHPGLYDAANKLFHLRNESYQQRGVYDVEACVEGGQSKRQSGGIHAV